MKYIEIYPQIPGALSECSDTEVVNAKVVFKNYVMGFRHDDINEVDDLLEADFHYLFSERLKKGIEDSGMRGLTFIEIKAIQVDTRKPFGRKYFLGKIAPFSEGSDIFVDEHFNLQVSARFCDLLKNYRIDRASIGELPLGARVQDEIFERRFPINYTSIQPENPGYITQDSVFADIEGERRLVKCIYSFQYEVYDDIFCNLSYYFVTAKLKLALEKGGVSGAAYMKVEGVYESSQASVEEELYLLVIKGKDGVDDIILNEKNELSCSDKAVSVLRSANVERCTFGSNEEVDGFLARFKAKHGEI